MSGNREQEEHRGIPLVSGNDQDLPGHDLAREIVSARSACVSARSANAYFSIALSPLSSIKRRAVVNYPLHYNSSSNAWHPTNARRSAYYRSRFEHEQQKQQ